MSVSGKPPDGRLIVPIAETCQSVFFLTRNVSEGERFPTLGNGSHLERLPSLILRVISVRDEVKPD